MKHKVDVFCFCYCIRYAKINEIWGKVRTTMKHKVDVFGESSNFVLFFVFSYFVLTFDLTLWWFVIAFYVFWWCDYMLVWWFVWCVFSMMFDSFSCFQLTFDVICWWLVIVYYVFWWWDYMFVRWFVRWFSWLFFFWWCGYVLVDGFSMFLFDDCWSLFMFLGLRDYCSLIIVDVLLDDCW